MNNDESINQELHPLIPRANDRLYDHLRKRHAKETRFRTYGIIAIGLATTFLIILLGAITLQALPAFRSTEIMIDLSQTHGGEDYQDMITEALKNRFPEVKDRRQLRALKSLLSDSAPYVLKNTSQYNATLLPWLPASSKADMAMKAGLENAKNLTEDERKFLTAFRDTGHMRTVWNTAFWVEADSREPEQAGILGGLVGSFFVIIICMAVAFPVGVAAAVYLEEFAPRNRLFDIVEINVNNLAAVPSIVYGLLALSVFLHGFGLPRSSSLVGGLSLSLLVMPVIIIATRQALKSVPPSLRDAAIAVGASPLQVVFHHTLPAATPGIMTGTILAVARALGETAPLLMIGMVAFIASTPQDVLQPAASLPVQVYLWSDSPEAGFREKTSAAILVLLGLLVMINLTAVIIRRKFERKW